MLKLIIFCIGFFIFNVTATEYPVKTSSDDSSDADSENIRNYGIGNMKRLFEIITKENNLTCENYSNYCTEEYKSPNYNTSYFRTLCEVGIKGYLCDDAKDGEAFAQLYDKISGFINDDTATEYPIKTPSGDYVVNEETRSRGIAAMKSFFENMTKEENLTCKNYLSYCTKNKSNDETSHFGIFCEVGIKGYLCDNAKDGEALAQLYDKVVGYVYDAVNGHGSFSSSTTTTPTPPPKPLPEYD